MYGLEMDITNALCWLQNATYNDSPALNWSHESLKIISIASGAIQFWFWSRVNWNVFKNIFMCFINCSTIYSVWFCCCLPSHIYHKPCPSQWQSCISSMRRIQAKHCRWIAKIKWYNAPEYFIINDSQCSTIFGSSRFTFQDSLHRIAFIFSPLPSSLSII